MAYGGYGKNSPDYGHTHRPYTPAPTPTPVPAPATLPAPVRPTPMPRVEPTATGEHEHCPGCARKVHLDFLVCPYCRHDLDAARKARKAHQCTCGAPRLAGDQHCFKCGTKHAQ